MKEFTPEDFKDPARFKEAREKLGLSQDKFAQALGLSDNRAIRRYEQEEREISGPISRLVWFFIEHGIPPVFRQ